MIRSWLRLVLLAVLFAFLISTFLFRPYRIPSQSMEPNLMKGDVVIVSKYSLGYGKYAVPWMSLPIKKGRIFEHAPKRGDILVFRPVGSRTNFIKRLVGFPGDEVQMLDGFVYINGQKQKTQAVSIATQMDAVGNPMKYRQYKESFADTKTGHIILDTQDGHQVDNTGIYHIPDGHYFFMGDNRDNSLDSRYLVKDGGAGFVPASHLIGRAEFILLSVEDGFSIKKPWTWLSIRGDRFVKGLGAGT